MTAQMLHTFGPSFVGVVLIVTVHLLAGKMHFLDRQDGRWLDFLAGIAVAYVFVDIVPHLAGKQEQFARLDDRGINGFLQHHIYILALAGFLIYLGLILLNEDRRKSLLATEITLATAPLPVKIEAVSVAGYSFIIGYMLAEQPTHRVEPSRGFAMAMAAHLVGLDHLFHHRYPRLYVSVVRYLLGVAVLTGWVLGLFVEISGLLYAGIFAFLAGGITIVTMIFELPRVTSRQRYWSFCAGAAVFTFVVLVLEFVKAID